MLHLSRNLLIPYSISQNASPTNTTKSEIHLVQANQANVVSGFQKGWTLHFGTQLLHSAKSAWVPHQLPPNSLAQVPHQLISTTSCAQKTTFETLQTGQTSTKSGRCMQPVKCVLIVYLQVLEVVMDPPFIKSGAEHEPQWSSAQNLYMHENWMKFGQEFKIT